MDAIDWCCTQVSCNTVFRVVENQQDRVNSQYFEKCSKHVHTFILDRLRCNRQKCHTSHVHFRLRLGFLLVSNNETRVFYHKGGMYTTNSLHAIFKLFFIYIIQERIEFFFFFKGAKTFF